MFCKSPSSVIVSVPRLVWARLRASYYNQLIYLIRSFRIATSVQDPDTRFSIHRVRIHALAFTGTGYTLQHSLDPDTRFSIRRIRMQASAFT